MPSVIAPFWRFGQWKTVEGLVTNLRNQCNGNRWPIWPLDGDYIITVAFNGSMNYLSVLQQVSLYGFKQHVLHLQEATMFLLQALCEYRCPQYAQPYYCKACMHACTRVHNKKGKVHTCTQYIGKIYIDKIVLAASLAIILID